MLIALKDDQFYLPVWLLLSLLSLFSFSKALNLCQVFRHVLEQVSNVTLSEKKLDYLCNCMLEISDVRNVVEGHCLHAMKIVHHYANSCFDWLISGQQSVNPSREAISLLSGKCKRFSFVHRVGYYFLYFLCSHFLKHLMTTVHFVTAHLEIFHCTHHPVIPKSDLYFTFCSTLNALSKRTSK